MSFRANANHVRNTELPIWKRLCALRSCIVPLSNLTGEGYRAAVQRFDTLYGFNRYRPRTDPPTEAQLLATLTALEAERNHWIAQRRDEALHNRETKRARKNAQRASAPRYLWGIPCATREQFDKTITKSRPTLVSVMASWDSSSARLSFVLRRWKAGTQQWRWLMVDCDLEIELCQELKIATTPTLLVYQRGRLLERGEGIFWRQNTTDPVQTIREWLARTEAVE